MHKQTNTPKSDCLLKNAVPALPRNGVFLLTHRDQEDPSRLRVCFQTIGSSDGIHS